ncbi:hypothetical protein QJR52_06665 [Clostridium baratii]|uniref:hypothetical protein n=1 Tax=Clostridium baratii TaxID=1561 RepID=UPI0030D6137E
MNIKYDINTINKVVKCDDLENVDISKIKSVIKVNTEKFLNGDLVLFHTIIQNLEKKVYFSLEKHDEMYGLICNNWRVDGEKIDYPILFCKFTNSIDNDLKDEIINSFNYILEKHLAVSEQVQIQNNIIRFVEKY